MLNGSRPTKPQNAPAIGLSDSLWDFIQLCWDSDRTRRPTAAEVLECLEEDAPILSHVPAAVEPGPEGNDLDPPRVAGEDPRVDHSPGWCCVFAGALELGLILAGKRHPLPELRRMIATSPEAVLDGFGMVKVPCELIRNLRTQPSH